MAFPTITQKTVSGVFLGDNEYAYFTVADADIPVGGLDAGYVLGMELGTANTPETVSATVGAVLVLAESIPDGADAIALCCIRGAVRADALTFPAGQTLDGVRAGELTHRESLRQAGITAITRVSQLSLPDNA